MEFTKARSVINYCLKDDYEAAFQLLDPGGDPKLATDELGVTALHIASRQGKLDVVKELITRYGFDPNCYDANGTTPFHEACFSGSLATVRYVVEETKCDTRATNNLRESGLHIACKEGQEGTVKLLVTGNYCDPTWSDTSLNTAFHTAGYSGNSGIVKFLLESTTFHPATPNSSGDTLVHITCNWGWLDVLKMIDIDSDFIKYWELTNSEGITPFHLACSRNLKVLSYLVENHWEDALHLVCKAGKAETLARLLSQENAHRSRRNTQPILFLSMKYGYYKVAQCLIEGGYCKPNLTDENENTALHIACRYGWLELAKALVSKYGSNPQQPNKDGETPVHIACKEGHFEIVKFLTIGNHIKWYSPHEGGSILLRSACLGTDTFRVVKFLFKNFHFNLDFSNTDGNTPLHVACHSGNLEALMFLVFGRYCNLNKQNKDGDTPLHIACGGHSVEVVEFLVCGRIQSTLNNCFSHLRAITPLTVYCNPDITNKNGQTALDVAWLKGELQIVKLLVQYQEMFPAEISDDGSTVLHKACELGWLSSVNYLVTMKQYRPDQTNALLQTPLHIAGYEGNVKAIHLLLKEGYCNPHLEDINGNTILHTACNLNLPSLAKVLVVKYNCSPTKPNRWGISPFHVACSGGISECINQEATTLPAACCTRNLQVVEFLIPHYNPKQLDQDGNTALHIACNSGSFEAVMFFVSGRYCDLDTQNRDGDTPLHVACRKGHYNIVEFLLTGRISSTFLNTKGDTDVLLSFVKGVQTVDFVVCEEHCNPDIENYGGLTALRIAWLAGHTDIVQLMIIYQYMPKKLLLAACENGWTDIVKYAVDCKSCNLEETNTTDDNVLHSACRGGHLEIVKTLLTKRSKLLEKYNAIGQTPLHTALFHDNIETLKVLVCSEHCNPDIPDSQGNTILHKVCEKGDLDLVHFLISGHHCSPEKTTNDGFTCLHLACLLRGLTLVNYLISDHHCSPEETTNLAYTCLHLACYSDNLDVIDFLISGHHCSPEKTNDDGDTCLHLACDLGGLEIVQYLLACVGSCNPDLPNHDGDTPLHLACRRGDFDLVKHLVTGKVETPIILQIDHHSLGLCAVNQNQCNPEQFDNDGRSPLNVVLKQMSEEGVPDSPLKDIVKLLSCYVECIPRDLLLVACEHGWLNVVQYALTSKNCNLEETSTAGENVLHIVCRAGHLKIAKILVTRSPTLLEDRNKIGQTPLHTALSHNNIKILKVLICSEHCNPDIPDSQGNTILHEACGKGDLDLVHFLISGHHCSPEKTNNDGDTCLHIACCLGHLDMVEFLISGHHCSPDRSWTLKSDGNSFTCLHLACMSGNLSLVNFLISGNHCSPEETTTNCTSTCLHIACFFGHLDLVHFLISGHHCSPDKINKKGNTCLQLACYGSHLDIVQYLLACVGSCNPNLPNHDGDTPLHLVCRRGDFDLVKCLVTGKVETPTILRIDPHTLGLCAVNQNQCNPEQFNKENCSPLNVVLKQVSEEGVPDSPLKDIVKFLACYVECIPRDLLLAACEHGWINVVQYALTSKNCNLDETNTVGENVLHIACRNGYTKIAMSLLAKNPVLLDKYDTMGQTPLHTALSHNNIETLKVLVYSEHCNPDIPDSQGNTILHKVCEKGDLDLVHFLISGHRCSPERTNNNGDTCLHLACFLGELEIVQYLLACGSCNPDFANLYGDTPLHLACRRGEFDLVKCLVTGKVETPIILQIDRHTLGLCAVNQNQCNPELFNKENCSPLDIVYEETFTDEEGILSFPNRTHMEDLLILYVQYIPSDLFFVACENRWTDIVQYALNSKNCNLDETNNLGENVLHIACRAGYTKIAMILLTKKPELLDKYDTMGHTPLHSAFYNNIETLKVLVCNEHCNPDISDSQGNTILHKACEKGDLDLVHFLISGHHCSPDKTNKKGNTSLHQACYWGKLEIVQYLLACGSCNPDFANLYGDTPLHLACRRGEFDLVKCLVTGKVETPTILQIDHHTLGLRAVNQNQCNPEQFNKENCSPLNVVLKQVCKEGVPDSPLKDIAKLLACYVECIPRDLLAACEYGWLNVVQYALTSTNCNLDGTDALGENVLHIACRNGYTKIAMSLLAKKPVLLDKYDTKGQTPLHMAFFHNNMEILKTLVCSEHCNPDIPDSQGNTILHKACEKGDLDLVHFLITGHHCSPEKTNKKGNTCLSVACYWGKHDIVSYLLACGSCDPNLPNCHGYTPLHLACRRGDFDLVKCLVTGNVETPTILQIDHHTLGLCAVNQNQCNPEQLNKENCSPLHVVSKQMMMPGSPFNDITKLLACYVEYIPRYLLLVACEYGWLNIVQYALTSCNLDVIETNSLGENVLHIACRAGHSKIAKILFTRSPTLLEDHNEMGQTPLHTALSHNNIKILKLLVCSEHCNPDIPDSQGNTVLHKACEKGDLDLVHFLISGHHCSPENLNIEGNTCLHVACYSGQIQIVQYLLSSQVLSPDLPNEDGYIPLHIACETGNVDLVKCLVTGEVNKCTHSINCWQTQHTRTCAVGGQQCNPELTNNYNLTPFDLAWNGFSELQTKKTHRYFQYMDIVKILLPCTQYIPKGLLHVACKNEWNDIIDFALSSQTCDLQETDDLGNTVLHVACKTNRVTVVKDILTKNPGLLDKQNIYGQTPLHTALFHDNIENLKLLVCSEHCNPDIPYSQGNTILHKVCEIGDLDLVHFLISGHHCSPDKTNNDGDTCLHLACNGNLEIVQYLVGGGFCHPNIPNKNGDTPLHIACIKNNFDVVKYLVTREVSTHHHLNFQTLRLCAVTFSLCNPEHVNSAGHTALSYAWMMNKSIFRFLVPYSVGNDQSLHRIHFLLHTAVKEGWPTELLKYLHTANRTTMKDSKGNTPIHIACNKNNWKAVKTLLTCHPTYLEERNDSGDLPLHLACKSGSLDLIKILLSGKYCNLDFLNEAGQTPLHIAFKQYHNSILEFLITGWHCNPHSPDSDGNTILHLACQIGDVYIAGLFVHNHFCDLSHSTSASNNHGDTPLHLASRSNHFEIVEMLLPYHYHYLERQNSVGDTPLHDACRSGDFKLTKLLVSVKYCNLDFLNNEGEGPLHIAYKVGHTDIAMFLITGWHCNPNFADSDGNTILHLACRKGDLHTVEFLISNLFCDPTLPNKHGNTLLHVACFRSDLNLLQSLLHHCNPNNQNCAGNTPLHIACRNGDINAVIVLTSRKDVSLHKLNHEGNTPLHIACSRNSKAVALWLLNKVKGSVSWKNAMGKTPMQLTTDDEIIRELIGYGADPQELYDRFQDVLSQSKANHPLKSFVKVFICGNPSTGKSTLAKALQSESKNPVLALTSRVTGSKVKGVDCYTAGISLSQFKGKKFGHVLLYDFAGHFEYYGSHEAILESTVSSSAPVFFILINLEEEEGVIARQLHYWLSFLGVHCVGTLTNPHVIVVGSHLDILKDNSENTSIKKLLIIKTAQAEAYEAGLKFVGYVQLDCRKFESTRMAAIRDFLSKSCEALRAKVEIDSQCHILFAVLVEEFSGVAALALFSLISRIKSASSNLPLPHVPDKLLDLLSILNDRGHILLLRNAESPLQSWIILDQTVLLQEVNATVFAPETFRQHHDLAHSSTGVVPFTRMQRVFSNHDPDMIIQFLVNLEFCRKISDETVLSLICPAMAGKPDLYYFFPALVNAERPDPVWKPDSQLTSASGWCLQCTKQGQFFTPRFLQVLLLRLTFSFAAIHDATDQESDPPVLRRKCRIWKNGLHWADTSGCSALVEITEQNTAVIVLVRSLEESTLDCVKLRSGITKHVLKAKEDFCSTVKTIEFFIDPSEVQQYPLSCDIQNLTVFSIGDIADSVVQGKHCVTDKSGTHPTRLDALFQFEPYSTTIHDEMQEKLWRSALGVLFDQENAEDVVPEKCLIDFANFMAGEKKILLFAKMFHVRKSELEAIQEDFKGTVVQLHHIFYHWKECLTLSGTYSDLHSTLDQYSIFCGRSPLDVAHGETRLKREPLQSQ